MFRCNPRRFSNSQDVTSIEEPPNTKWIVVHFRGWLERVSHLSRRASFVGVLKCVSGETNEFNKVGFSLRYFRWRMDEARMFIVNWHQENFSTEWNQPSSEVHYYMLLSHVFILGQLKIVNFFTALYPLSLSYKSYTEGKLVSIAELCILPAELASMFFPTWKIWRF